MLDACVLTIVRDGDDYLGPCLRAIIPHVKRVRITVDSRSRDRSWSVAKRLQEEFGTKVEVSMFEVKEPLTDLVDMRNSQMGFPEEWGFIVDSDEFHYEVPVLGNADAYAFHCWAPWEGNMGHKASQRAIIGRIFRNSPDIEWRGNFGKEKLYNGDKRVFDDAVVLPNRYIHFTHLKKDNWRQELKQLRVADGRDLSKLPDNVIKIIDYVYEEMSTMWR